MKQYTVLLTISNLQYHTKLPYRYSIEDMWITCQTLTKVTISQIISLFTLTNIRPKFYSDLLIDLKSLRYSSSFWHLATQNVLSLLYLIKKKININWKYFL
jgi:hypothetical protein